MVFPVTGSFSFNAEVTEKKCNYQTKDGQKCELNNGHIGLHKHDKTAFNNDGTSV